MSTHIVKNEILVCKDNNDFAQTKSFIEILDKILVSTYQRIGTEQKKQSTKGGTKNAQKLSSVLENIKKGTYKQKIDLINKETDEDKQSELKKDILPYFTLSGVCFDSKRSAETFDKTSYTGLIQIDFDKKENPNIDFPKLKNDLILDCEFALSIFDSPRKGIKLIAYHNLGIAKHKEVFEELEKYFLYQYNAKIDKSCKDIARAFFMSYDKDLYKNECVKPFDYEFYKSLREDIPVTNTNTNTKNKFESFFDFASYCVNTYNNTFFIPGSKSKFRMLFAKIASVYSVNESEILSYINQNFASVTGSHKDQADAKQGFNYANALPKKIFVPYSQYIANLPKNEPKNKPKTDGTKEPTKETKQTKHSNKGKKASKKELLIKYLCEIGLGFDKNTNEWFLNETLLCAKKTNDLLSTCIEKFAITKDFFYIVLNGFELQNKAKEVSKYAIFAKDFRFDFGNVCYFDKLCNEIEFTNNDHKEFYKQMIKKWFVGFWANLLSSEKDAFNDLFLLFVGKKNIGKTYFVQSLCEILGIEPAFFTKIPSENDLKRSVKSNLILFLDDIKSVQNIEHELRSVISQKRITYVQKYENHETTFLRTASFLGSTNETSNIYDTTNNRRFIPLFVNDLRNVSLCKGIFAQSLMLFESGFEHKINVNECEYLSVIENKDFTKDFESELIFEKIQPCKEDFLGSEIMTATEILNLLHNTTLKVNKIGIILKKLGFIHVKDKTRKGKRLPSGYIVIKK